MHLQDLSASILPRQTVWGQRQPPHSPPKGRTGQIPQFSSHHPGKPRMATPTRRVDAVPNLGGLRETAAVPPGTLTGLSRARNRIDYGSATPTNAVSASRHSHEPSYFWNNPRMLRRSHLATPHGRHSVLTSTHPCARFASLRSDAKSRAPIVARFLAPRGPGGVSGTNNKHTSSFLECPLERI